MHVETERHPEPDVIKQPLQVSVLGVFALVAVLCIPQALLAADLRADDRYTVFVELRQPYESNRAKLQEMLRDEGYESHAERQGEIALVLTAEQIGKLFQAWIRLRKVEAGASGGTITQPFLEGARIPARFEKLIRRVYFDSQRS